MRGATIGSATHGVRHVALPGFALTHRRSPIAGEIVQAHEHLSNFSRRAAHRNIEPHRILTRVMTSDETPLLLNKRFSMMVAGLCSIVRCGRETANLLCERTFFAGFDDSGDKKHTIVIKEPTLLSEGKTGWNLFSCRLVAAPDPLNQGWRGPKLYHYDWGRGCYSFLDRATRTYHEVKKQQFAALPDGRVHSLLTFCTTRADSFADYMRW